jgi:hypothetical protein
MVAQQGQYSNRSARDERKMGFVVYMGAAGINAILLKEILRRVRGDNKTLF